ncbi:putative pleiotropic drug resistance protein 2-like [Capsicum annuum]|uniref:uncharacterized protein LOC107847397 n=1 Tax=Capsicum annuum TaxID=4072 RepID=UPI0007BF7E9C|nr:uncharacterized protein LOC107847397 [Capsicum annuum]KAF3654949.1 putative pleiotropic drug resistance protein 2-like [Capsicum annuum]KAF3683920.1 putative pleiotropic drug resistance protein 2-like [Capsicum annuum]
MRGERRFGGDARGPPRLPERRKDPGYSPRQRSRNRDYSSPRRMRDGGYSPRRRIRDNKDYTSPPRRIRGSPPIRSQERRNSPPRRYQGREYSPVGSIRNRERSPPVRSRNQEYSPPGRNRNREISPPARTRNWEQHSPRGRSRERRLSPSGQMIGEQRGEYFHELERSRRMGVDGGGDFRQFQNAPPLNYVGGDRDYGPSQSLRIPDRDRGNTEILGEHSHRLHETKEGLGNEDSTSIKYPWSHLLDKPRKYDTVKGSRDYGVGDSRVSSERENCGRPYPGFVDGSISSEADKRTLYSSYESHLPDVGVQPRISGVGNGGGYSLPSRYLDADHLKDEEMHLQDGFHPHKAAAGVPASANPYMEDSFKSTRYPEFNTDYVISSSHPNMLPSVPGVNKDDIATPYSIEGQIRSHGGRLSSRKVIEPIGRDGYDKIPGTISSLNPETQVNGLGSYSESYFGRAEDKREAYNYSDIQRGEVGSPNGLSSEFYGKREAHFQDVPRSNMGLSKYDEFSHREILMEDKPRGSLFSSQRGSTPDYFESRRGLDQRKPDVDILDYGANRLQYEHETHRSYESSRKRELHKYQMDDDLLGRSNALYREADPHLEKMEARSHEGFISRDLPGPSNLSLSEKHGTTSNRDAGIMISSDVRSAHRIHDRGDADEKWINRNTDSVVKSRKPSVPRSKYVKNTRPHKAAATYSSTRTLSVSMSSRISKFGKSGGRDIKKRLGPRSQNLDIECPIGTKYKPSLKKRLGPRLVKNNAPPPWVKKFNSHEHSKNQDMLDESVAEQGDDPKEGIMTPAKTEPPENSKDFKQLVQNAFFRFVRHLNETPAKRRKYIEEAGSLKCLVCGRDSEEFAESESLVRHALTSSKAGLRSQHLGLQKALCALMGWKSADAHKDCWVREKLSNAETMALKEDLIIWPPVVIIHNSSITSNNQDQRVVVSAEELESQLRDMGFGEKAKVSRGKPANQSILMVKFSATLSGLEEATRLSDIYAHRKHGREEFQRISSGHSGNNDDETKEPLTDKVGKILYGYLGIAEDLDKVDFETKKRSSVRSKKQIKDIAVAP